MTLNDYRDQFRRNLTTMSRTANGGLDLSASATKADSMKTGSAEEAKSLTLENTDRAIEFLYDNRRRYFKSSKELEELILQAAEITNRGIVREGCLFRSGEDSIKYKYARIKDIPAIWAWFTDILYWLLTTQCFEVEEIAAFCEYVINIVGHFFSDGCGKISMLVSAYVFMRFDMECPVYSSREEYYRAAIRDNVPTVSEMHRLMADPEFWDFVSYYLRLCPSREVTYNNILEKQDDGSYLCHLNGFLTGERNRIFRENIEAFYKNNGDAYMIFDCSMLAWIDIDGISVFTELKEDGKKFTLKNLNADCLVLFIVEGFEAHLDEDEKLPEIDLGKCEKVNEGANGVIYRVNDEVVAKTFKSDPDYYDLVRHRIAQKNALISGVPAPFSFGYAMYDGKIVTLMELIRSKSLLQVITSEEDSDGYIIRYAQFIKQLHEIQEENKLKYFTRNLFGEEILSKADRCDGVLPESYKGRARRLIEEVEGPECLVHGDIHPKNIMVCGDEMMFIDFDSFSTGKAVYDIGALYRSLVCNENKGITDRNTFLDLSFEECLRIWDIFIGEYYKDDREEDAQRKVTYAKLIGTVLALAKMIKNHLSPEIISGWTDELEKYIDILSE